MSKDGITLNNIRHPRGKPALGDLNPESLETVEIDLPEPVAWKLMPRDATDSMLKAMDECSTEGYDERLYAGHAASVYMAAWDEAPTPPQRTWVGLTDGEIEMIYAVTIKVRKKDIMPGEQKMFAKTIEHFLKERNT